MEDQHSNLRAGVRAALPLLFPTLAVGISFGVLAEPVMGSVAPIVMSVIVFAGSAQFAALSVLAAGGGAPAAITAGLLMNTRFLPMGFAVAPALRGGPLKRAAQGQAVIDTSLALASRGEGGFDRGLLVGATIPQAACWISGTAIGALGGSVLSEPERFGIDAIFPAFFLALLVKEARRGLALGVAVAGGLVTLALLPFLPPGLAVIAAFLTALVGLRRP